jgi:hypothetical protein
MLASLKKYKNTFVIIGVAIVAFFLGVYGRSLFSGTGAGLSGAAGAIADQGVCDTSVLANEDPTGIVLADPLNLRAGPGLDYSIITTLEICTPVSLNGRTGDYAWLEVSLPGNIGGWVFSGYVQANINIGDLDVTTAFGGPNSDTSPGSNSGGLYVSVVIQGNQAVAFVYGMPANEDISAVLSPSDNSANGLLVASGQTDAQGNTALTFTMPTTWADGSALKSGTMTLTLTAGGQTLTAFITYYTNQ